MTPPVSQTSNKQLLRRQLRARRRNFKGLARQQASKNINHRLAAWFRSHQLRNIAGYCAFDGEVELDWLMRQSRFKIYLPRVGNNHQLSFHPKSAPRRHYSQRKPLNRYGIAEPIIARRISPARIQVILLPLVGFDTQGNRLGMGAGFYDRFLASCPNRPKTIGVAFSFQQVETLPTDPWDQPLDAIMTERGLIIPSTNGKGRA